MKTLSNGLAQHIAGEVTTLAHCWKVKRKDGLTLGFTDHDCDIIIDGLTYTAASGMTPSAVSAHISLKVDELDIAGMLSSDVIKQTDILDGLYDYAEMSFFLVNYQDVSQGKIALRTGWMGEISLKGQQFVAEVRGLTQALSQSIGEIYSAGCRASFADARCTVNAANYTVSGTVSAVNGLVGFSDAARTQASGYFTLGVVKFLSGALAGVSVEVKEYSNKQFIFALPLRVSPQVGDSYSAIAGCDKSLETCITRFGNALNFRGEPHVPGSDRLLETSATRSTW